ncbi:MAG TPA: glycosyltransferase family 9 protein, partial [Candidatus Polarisedimenticolaceae bacterium]|nr:glycosyltransferase family 9 protein [Candidatus Polarisedimenticolaceae bacterium]
MRELPRSWSESVARDGRDTTVLVVRLGAMGDILRTLPAVRQVRAALPLARLHWVLDEPWSPLLAGHPDLDGLVPLPRSEWRRQARSWAAWPALVRSILAFRRRLRALRPDATVDFHGNLRSGVVSWMSGAKLRIGYAGHQQREASALFLTHRLPAGERRLSRVERHLALVRALGIPDADLPRRELPLARAGRGVAIPPARFAVISPGASRRQSYKRPPPALLAACCRRLAE